MISLPIVLVVATGLFESLSRWLGGNTKCGLNVSHTILQIYDA